MYIKHFVSMPPDTNKDFNDICSKWLYVDMWSFILLFWHITMFIFSFYIIVFCVPCTPKHNKRWNLVIK